MNSQERVKTAISLKEPDRVPANENIWPATVDRWHKEHGIQTILHSCGRLEGLIPDLIDSGFDCLQSLEAKAGMDVRKLKPKFGDKIAFFGNIDVMLMEEDDNSRIENEIRDKFSAAMPSGGCLYCSDHSIPKDVSFEKYKFVMECVRRYGRYAQN